MFSRILPRDFTASTLSLLSSPKSLKQRSLLVCDRHAYRTYTICGQFFVNVEDPYSYTRPKGRAGCLGSGYQFLFPRLKSLGYCRCTLCSKDGSIRLRIPGLLGDRSRNFSHAIMSNFCVPIYPFTTTKSALESLTFVYVLAL